MKTTPLALLACLAVAGCADGSEPLAPLAPLAPDGPRLAAIAFTDNLIIPIDLLVFVDCANGGLGEEVLLSGNLHLLFHVTENANGLHIKSLANPQGITGLGAVTGDRYHGTGMTGDNLNVGLGENFTFVNNFRIIGAGPGNNFLVHQNVHVTFNANGELTAEVDNFRAECK